MRRVDSEGDSQSSHDRERGGTRPSPARKSSLRRLALDRLEARTLLSTLPTPITVSQSIVGNGMTPAPNTSSPSVAIDPLDSNKLIAAWTTYDPNNKLDGPNGQVTTYVQGAYSTDGGKSWLPLPNATAADVQTDFSMAPSTSGPQPNFAQTTDATVGFGRDQNAYLLTSTHGAASGVLDLQKWDFSGATPVSQLFARPAYSQGIGFGSSSFLNPIYRWQGGDGALTPTLAVDSNVASFPSGGTTQTDPYAGNLYVAWETVDTAPANVTENPNTIKLMASSDNGQSFTYQTYLSDHGLGNTYDAPRIAISQGTTTVPGGKVTIVYDNAAAGTVAPFSDTVQTKTTSNGAADAHGDSPTNVPINLAVKDGVSTGVDAFTPTNIPIQVNVTDPKFTSLQNLTVSLSLSYPTLANTSAVLISPGGTRSVVLWNNATNNAGTAVNTGTTLTGVNMGASTLGPYIGTVLDSTAHRSILDTSATAPYTGHFRPIGNLQSAFQGLTNAQLSGTWTLQITDYRNETLTATTPTPALIGASLDLTSGFSDISPNGQGVRVATSFLNSGTKPFTDGIQGVPVLPNASIASDNSLGAFSAHQGRLYIALTNDNYVAATGAYTTSTFIQLYTSDNFGASWTYAGIVNDDNGVTDGFSNGGYAQPGSGIGLTNPQLAFGGGEANVRPKIEPQVAVDPATGTLVVSFLDTRNDASAVRVANYVAISDDGGGSFAPETYANPSAAGATYPVSDAIAGGAVNLGPVPDNESSGNNNQEATFGFGQRQGLAVLNGHIIPVWSSNLNAGSALLNQKVGLHVESAVMTFAAGPRVLSSTQGPVGEAGDTVNTTRAADGTPIANTIQITFDRAVDPTSFLADGATIGTSPLQVFYNAPGNTLGSNAVPLRVLPSVPGDPTLMIKHNAANTVYTITFDPAGHGVGTYSYTLRPLVRGLVPYQAIVGGTTTTVSGNLLDQTPDGTPGAPTDAYKVPTGRNSLPLVVPGPHVISTSVVGINGTHSTGTDNLVNNDNAKSINVTFDRDMQVSTFTPAQILSITGPTGRIDGPQTFVSTGTSKNYAYVGAYQLIPKSGTLTSTIPIAGTGLDVSSLTVQVNITDPDDSSLKLTLEAPDGTMVPLVAAGTASGANFTNTTFSDSPTANGLTSTIPAGAAPYSLTYQPASPLAALAGKVLDGTWKLLVTDSTAAPSAQGRLNTWSLGVTPQVPQGAGTHLNSTLAIASYADNSFLISHLAVQLNVSSTADSDLQINLISPKQPNGSQVVVPLVASMAASGANFANTTFDDNGTIAIGSGTAPYSLTYRPSSPLSALDGLSINGTWTLQVINPNADTSVTTLNSWSLTATPQLTVTPVSPANGVARTFAVGFPTQTLSGTYAVTLSPNILSATANPANPSSGTPLDTNLNAGVDALRGTSAGPTTTVTFPATAVPVAIPYAGSTPGVLTSQINVTDNFAIQGDVGTLSGLTVSLNISYYYDPDLAVTLTAPNGKTINLFMGVGKGGTTANFTNTTLSDTITPLAPITAAAAPFFGTFNPEAPLSSLATDASGNQAFSAGLWTLTITNTGADPGSAADAVYPPSLLGWSLGFQKPQTNTGLGEAVADQKTVSFRLFNINPSNPLANDTWTAVGPAGTTNSTNATNLGGPVSVVALDPSDPSGNIAFVGASSGGVWKTTDFLTTSASGPTYVPLTDFGSNYSINIGGIAIFARNNDPNQSIVFAGTGDGQATSASVGNASQGVGILRSTNGGASFTLLDSSVNVDANGNPLPENSPLRDHIFVGSTTYKMVVDPTALPGGGVIVYAALGGKNGGLWRSIDGGDHWQLLRSGTATDVLLDPASASPSTGNLDILYAAFQGDGVYISTNRGQALSLLSGTVGATNLIQNSQVAPAAPLTVNDANTPNGPYGRIVLAKPALTKNAAENILYQDWLYVAVENTDGTFRGLYVTKDRGENWTLARISSTPTPPSTNAVTEALPTNDNTQANNYDVTAGATGKTHNGNSAFSLAVDPANANIVYLGGTQDYQTSGLIRVDLTGLYDAHAFVPFANDRNDGGKLTVDSTGRAVVNNINLGLPFYQGTSPSFFGGDNYVSLRHNPNNPFDTSSTLFVFNVSSFTNDGTGVKWTPIDQQYGNPLDGSTNVHQLLSVVDPLTGLTRLIISDDQGIFTGVYNADGTLSTSGIGTAATVTGSRNGNLQDEAIYYSAAQPSTLAAQAAGALFYGSGVGMTDVRSSSTLLSTGNLTWTVAGTSYGDLQRVLGTNDRGGTGIATDATGGVTSSNPTGNPSVYEYDVPFLGGDTTNFFRVNTNGQTTGLVNNFAAEFPANNALYNGVIPLGNFAVNPINGSQALISSNLGNLYETTNKGVQWLQIGSGSGDFDGTNAPAVTYGAPDPNGPNGVGNLNNFIYAGTVGGHIYITQTGAGPWSNISAGLDGSSVVAIYTNPNRGSHEAYAVTLKGVYYMANSVASGATWVNITGNLTQIQHNPNGDPAYAEDALLGYANGQLGGFRSIVADYRYAVPTLTPLATVTATGPAAGPGAQASVTSSLTLAANSTALLNTGAGNAGTATFNVTLVNSSSKASAYTISIVAPDGETTVLTSGSVAAATSASSPTTAKVNLSAAFSVVSASLNGKYSLVVANANGASVTINSWSLSLNAQSVTNNPVLYVSGYGGVFRSLDNGQTWTAFPNTSFDAAPVDGGYLPNVDVTSLTLNLGAINPATGHAGQVAGDPEVLLASTLGRGDFAIRLAPDVFPTTVGLDPTLPTPGGSATGALNGNPLTNLVRPFIAGTSEISNFGNIVTITLIDEANGLVIGTGTTDTFGHFSVQVGSLANDPSFGADGVKTVGVQATDSSGAKGNVTLFTYVLKTTVPPPAPTALTLDPSTNTGLNPAANITNSTHPLFDVTGVLPGDYIELFRSIGGSTPILVGASAVGATQVRDTTGVPADGVYLYKAAQVSAVGDVSPFSPAIAVTINTTTPPAPTIGLVTSDDSGLPQHPNVTNVRLPHFSGTAAYNAGSNFPLDILLVTNGNNAAGIPVTLTTYPSANGTYLAQTNPARPFADGTYTLVARTTNLAGTHSYSAPLTITIKGIGPGTPSVLAILPADDTGIKGDGVTANHSPSFTGTADPGVTVNLYAQSNGQLLGPLAPPVVANLNGAFTFSLPFNLTNGTTTLVAQAVDIANNKSPVGKPLSIRIISVAGDYAGRGAAQLSIFNPYNETYAVQTVGYLAADTTPGRDVPVEYDLNGDGKTDPVAYRYNTAEYYGPLSNGSTADVQFGPGGSALPVSGTFGGTGTFIYGSYNPNNGYWYLTLPQAGGEVVQFGIANLDIPVPAAYNGGGVTQIAVFRPSSSVAADEDSFTVVTGATSSTVTSSYRVSFNNPAVIKLGFNYKPGDVPAPADYDGVGRDEFAIYRPSTGQFFILNTPNINNTATWTLRTVTLNLPGGPNVNDVPASEDYDGNGKIDPTVYRPSNSTFYIIHSSNGLQSNNQFGQPGVVIASAGPLLYRLTALKGSYVSNGGYPKPEGGGVGTAAFTAAGSLHVQSIASASNSSTSSSSAVPSLVALASPLVLGAPAQAPTFPTTSTAALPPATSTPQAPKSPVIVGASTPKTFIPVVAPSKPSPTAMVNLGKAAKAKTPKTPAKPLVVDSKPHAVEAAAHAKASKAPAATAKLHPAVALLALQKVVKAKKGGHQG